MRQDPFEIPVRGVFFSRGSMPPSEFSRDFGWAGLAPLLVFPAFFALIFFVLKLPPILADGISIQAHAKALFLALSGRGDAEHLLLWREAVGELTLAERAALGLRVALSGLGAGWIAWLSSKSALRPISGYRHVGGRVRLVGDVALRAARAKALEELDPTGKSALRRADYLVHPQLPFTADRWTKMALIVGRVGSGKTVIMAPIAEQAILAGDKILIHDIKGDYLSIFRKERDGRALKGNRVALIAPWDERSLIWDISADTDTEQAAKELAARFIEASKDPMWANLAREVFVGCVKKLQYDYAKTGEPWGFPELAALLEADPDTLEKVMLDVYPEAIRAITGADNTVAGVLANMSSGCAPIFALALAWPKRDPRRMFSMREWVARPKVRHPALIMAGNQKYQQLSQALSGTLFFVAAQTICSPELPDDPTRKLTLLLDEFPRLGKVDVEPIIAVGRSKGVRVILGVQDLNQLKVTYGAEQAAGIAAMVSTTICTGSAAGESAEEIARWAGNEVVERSSVSTSGGQGGSSHSWQSETRPVLLPSHISALGLVPGKGIRALMLGFDEAAALVMLWPFFTPKNNYKARTVSLAPWTRPGFDDEARNLRGERAARLKERLRGPSAKTEEQMRFMDGGDPSSAPPPPRLGRPDREEREESVAAMYSTLRRDREREAPPAPRGPQIDPADEARLRSLVERKDFGAIDKMARRARALGNTALFDRAKFEIEFLKEQEARAEFARAARAADDEADAAEAEEEGGSESEAAVSGEEASAETADDEIALAEAEARGDDETASRIRSRVEQRRRSPIPPVVESGKEAARPGDLVEVRRDVGPAVHERERDGQEEREVGLHAATDALGTGPLQPIHHAFDAIAGADFGAALTGTFMSLLENDPAPPRRTVENGRIVETTLERTAPKQQ